MNNNKFLAESLKKAANIDAGTKIEPNNFLTQEALINGANISHNTTDSEFGLDEETDISGNTNSEFGSDEDTDISGNTNSEFSSDEETDISGKAADSEFGLDQGVTDNAPYQNIAEYKMVSYLSDEENKNKKNMQNSQSS